MICLSMNLIICHVGFDDIILVLIVAVPGLWLLF